MRADNDHEALLHDIIRLPSKASVDHDHESQIHDIIGTAKLVDNDIDRRRTTNAPRK